MVWPRTIRGRLARVLAVSLTLVLALIGVIMNGEVGNYLQSGETVRAVSLLLAVQDLVHEAQLERGLTNGVLAGDAQLSSALAKQRDNTDHAMLTLNALLSGNDAPGADQTRSALNQLSILASVREGVDAGQADRLSTYQFYTGAIGAINQLHIGQDQATDPQMRHGLKAIYALADTMEQTGQERDVLYGVFAANRFGPGEYLHVTEVRAWKQAAIYTYGREATPAQRTRMTAVLRTQDDKAADAAEAIAMASGGGPLPERVDPANWWDRNTTVVDGERAVERYVGADIQRRAAALQREAATILGVYVLVATLAVALEVLLVIGSLRSILRPLATLSAEADDVAVRRLPEAIARRQDAGPDDAVPPAPTPVHTAPHTGTEIASVAAALDRVQTTAFELAAQQALSRRNTSESLANLGRRIQSLVHRQLEFISDFEHNELDPTALANLFELDHLATRMRRNSESLLILVGESSPRRWAEPIALKDVIRAGLSEVEGYRRVVLRRVDETLIVGSVAGELAHMLAELIENALAFSPPNVEVEVHGKLIHSGYLLAVVDHGVGMSKEQLELANARLRGDIDFLVEPTRFLGHFVVGKLARRHGIDVELTTAVSGVMARLTLPAALLAESDAAPAPAGHVAAALPAALPAPAAARAAGPADRTRSGLVKRVKPQAPAPRRTAAGAPSAARNDRTPAQVRDMLSDFRSGNERGIVTASDADHHALVATTWPTALDADEENL